MDKKTMSLFGDMDKKAHETHMGKSLAIRAGHNKKLSKHQQTFNKLTKRIEQLQKTLRTETAKLETLLKIHMTEIPEKRRLLAQKRLMIAKALGNSTKTIKYGKRPLEKVRTVILILCNEAFTDMLPDEETQRFYDEWSDTNYNEEMQQQTDRIKMEFAEHARNLFGIDIDPDDIDDTPEGFARLAARLEDEFQNKWKDETGPSSNRKKTKKQHERERLRKREEELTQRSLRSIFISLAKALHPDTIIDPVEKARKEELMKKVTAAYAEKDLATLLKLEMEWIRSENRALDTLPEDELKLYITSLREQAEALEQELEVLFMHPRFEDISEFARYPEPFAVKQIHVLARDYGRVAGSLEEVMEIFSRPSPKQGILEFVNEYIAVITAGDTFEEDLLEDIFGR